MVKVTESRLGTLRQKIKERKVEGFLIKKPQNTFYLSRCWAEGGILLTKREKFFITTSLFAEEARSKLSGWQIVIQKDSFEEAVFQICKKLGSKKIGFEASHFSFEEYRKLGQIKGTLWIPCPGLVEKERAIKDTEEISCIRRALRVAKATFDYVEARLRERVTEKDLAREAIYFLRKDADEEAFPLIVLFGERTSLPHGKPTQRRLEKNELVLLDLGAKIEGYCSDLTRTIFFGRVKKKWHQIYHLITEAQKDALHQVKPGVICSHIDKTLREKIKEAGYGEVFLHDSGHGVGLEVHESPSITFKSKEVLKPGMVFTLEPGVYLEGEGGIRVEEMVLVTENGGEILE